VTNSDGQSGTLSNGYTYVSPNPPPTVGSISPGSGTTNGGTPVSVGGTGFLSGATVSLGGTPATNVNVVSSTSITATTAAHAAGSVNVVVTNSDGQSGTLSNGYTYTAGTGSGIQLVQKNTPGIVGGASRSLSFSSPNTAGDLIVVFLYMTFLDAGQGITSVTDSQANSYAGFTMPGPNNGLTAVYYAQSVLGGPNTVTVNVSQTINHLGMWLFEYQGIASANALDQEASQVAPSATQSLSTPYITTTQGNELLFVGFADSQGGGPGPGSGFTQEGIDGNYWAMVEEQVAANSGAYRGTGSYSSTANNGWAGIIVSFRGF
jgi:hypothetical protein